MAQVLWAFSPVLAQGDPKDIATQQLPNLAQKLNPSRNPAGSPVQRPAQVGPFSIEGVSVGAKVQPESAALKDFQCKPSDQFVGFDWCRKTHQAANAGASVTTNSSILRKADGTVVYVSRSILPSFLNSSEAREEIERLSKRFSEQAKIIWMPHREGFPDAVIAYWGKVQIEPLAAGSVSALAAGNSLREGFLLDFLGDFQKSARSGLPIYRFSGSAGYVWSASFYPDNRGHLRFVAIDVSTLRSPAPSQAATEVVQPKLASDAKHDPSEASAQDDRKARLQKLAAQTIKANPKFYEYLVKKTELAGLPGDIPILRVVFEERVFFDTAQWNLRMDALSVLDIVSNTLKLEPKGVVLFVAGHTDIRGGDSYNMDLSAKRAGSVAEAIKQRTDNINIWRIGFGKAIPLRANISPENMAVNRRVEFILASRLDAVIYWLRNHWKYLCVGDPASQPEFCKDGASLVGEFSAVPVTTIDVRPDTTTITAIEPLEIKLNSQVPDETEITLPPPPITEVGRPEL